MLTSKWGGVFFSLLTCGYVLAQTTQIACCQSEAQNKVSVLNKPSAVETGKTLSCEFPNATVQRDTEFGIVRQLRGKVAVRGAKTPSEAAQLFLKKYKRLFTNTPKFDEFRQIHEAKSLTGTSISFARHHAGLPVIDDLLSIFIGKGMNILQINNNITPIKTRLEAGSVFSVEKGQAVQIALTVMDEQQTPVEPPAGILSVAVLNGVAVAVWKVTFKTRKPAASWQVLVDAKSNQVIAKRNVALYSSK